MTFMTCVRVLLICLISYAGLCAVEQELQEFTLKNGQTLTGYAEDVGVDRTRIHIVFRGKVMASKEVKVTDIVSRKAVSAGDTVGKNPSIDTEKVAESDTDQQEQTKGKALKGSLLDQYNQSLIMCKEAKEKFNTEFLKFEAYCQEPDDEKGERYYNEIKRGLEQVLQEQLIAERTFYDVRLEQIRSGTNAGDELITLSFENELKYLRMKQEMRILKAEGLYAKTLHAQKWLKHADLKTVDEKLAGFDAAELKRVRRLNSELSTFQSMRAGTKNISKVIAFLENEDLINLYAQTR